MTRACIAAVHAATGKVFSDEEADDLVNKIAAKAIRAKKDAPTIDDKAVVYLAARELTREEVLKALVAKRSEAFAAIARDIRRPELDANAATMTPAQRLDALNVGSERQAAGVGASVDAEGRARQMNLWGLVDIGMGKMPGLKDRLVNFWGVGDDTFARKVAREMARLNGAGQVEPTGDEGALHAARVFVSALREAKKMQNDVGAWIDELPGYIARQSHDAEKVAGGYWRELAEIGRRSAAAGKPLLDWGAARSAAEARAFGAWRDAIMPKLDPATFKGLDASQFDMEAARGLAATGIVKDPTDLKELMLHTVFMDILTGRHEELSGMDDLGDYRPPASRARQVSASRTLHFKSPDDWMDYNAQYGRSGLYQAVMSQLGRGGRNAALMRRWGPNPAAAFEAEKARLVTEARAGGDVGAIKDLGAGKIQNGFDQVNGSANTPQNMRLASTMRTIRQWEAAAKLSGIVLSKATDLVLSGSTMARAGAGFLAGYEGFFRGISRLDSAEAKHAGELMDVGAQAFANHLTSQFMTRDGPAGWTAWATQMTYKLGLFNFANEGVHKGIAQVYARHLGVESAGGWDALRPGTRETFERFGITPADWEIARKSQATMPDGKTYWGMDKIDDADVKLKFSTMIHDVISNSTGEARARERRTTTWGTRPGTGPGEALRVLTQLKGFVTSVVGRHLVPASRGFGGYSPAACMAQLILGGTLAGYFSMNAKLIAAGQMPRSPIGEDDAQTRKTWSAALVQGGGLGIYGDFLFGAQNRNGAGFDWGQLGGPAVSDSEQIAQLVQQSLAGGDVSERTGRSPMPGELVRLAGRNIPIINTWYTRLALDYLVMWRLQEAASPGYLQRYEHRVETQEKRQWILPPTSAQ